MWKISKWHSLWNRWNTKHTVNSTFEFINHFLIFLCILSYLIIYKLFVFFFFFIYYFNVFFFFFFLIKMIKRNGFYFLWVKCWFKLVFSYIILTLQLADPKHKSSESHCLCSPNIHIYTMIYWRLELDLTDDTN